MATKADILNILGPLFQRTLDYSTRISTLTDVIPVAQDRARDQGEALAEKLRGALVQSSASNGVPLSPEQLAGLNQVMPNPIPQAPHQLGVTMRAAAIVFTHGFCDGAVSDMLAMCIRAEPQGWSERIVSQSRKKYTLAEISRISIQSEVDRAFDHYVRTLSHTSLPKKNGMLLKHTCCLLDTPFNSLRVGQKDLESLDQMRHSIMHADALEAATLELAAEQCMDILNHVLYLVLNTGRYFGVEMVDLFACYAEQFYPGTMATLAKWK